MSKSKSKVLNSVKDKEMYPPEIMNQEYIDKLMQMFRSQKKLPVDCVHVILYRARAQLEKLPNLIEVHVAPEKEMTVVGDTHGQFFDLMQIFEKNQLPSNDNPYLFNGDYVDRGSFGCETFLTLACMKLAYPNSVHLLRGNHESKQCTSEYGFKAECEDKYDFDIYLHFLHVFNALPLCALINRKIFVVHGGIPSQGNISLEELQHLHRFVEPGEEEEDVYNDDLEEEYFRCGGGKHIWGKPAEKEGPKAKAKQKMTRQDFNEGFVSFLTQDQRDCALMQMLWADPCEEHGVYPSLRFLGYRFGPNITKQFLEYNTLSKVIRSHEMRQRGYQVEHDGKLVTLFSCPNYCDNGNLGAYIKIKGGKPKNAPTPSPKATSPLPSDTAGAILTPAASLPPAAAAAAAAAAAPPVAGGDKPANDTSATGTVSAFASASASATPEASPSKPRLLTITRSLSAPNLAAPASSPPLPLGSSSAVAGPAASSSAGTSTNTGTGTGAGTGKDRACSPTRDAGNKKHPSSPPPTLTASLSASVLPALQANSAVSAPGGGAQSTGSSPSITMVFHTYSGSPAPVTKRYFTMPPNPSVCVVM